MADFRPYQAPNATTGARADAAIDQGLRAYMIKVYNLMAMGLVITGVAAWGAFQLAFGADGQITQFGQLIYASPLRWVVILARHATPADRPTDPRSRRRCGSC